MGFIFLYTKTELNLVIGYKDMKQKCTFSGIVTTCAIGKVRKSVMNSQSELNNQLFDKISLCSATIWIADIEYLTSLKHFWSNEQ